MSTRSAPYARDSTSNRMETRRSVLKPGPSDVRAVWRLRMNNPAPMSATTDSDNCPTTSALRRVRRRAPLALPLSPGFSAGSRSMRADCHAGAVPNTRPVRSDRPSAQPSTRRSGLKSRLMPGIWPSGSARLSACDVQKVSTVAIPPPTSAIRPLSVSSCRATRHRPAPSDSRMASSRLRAFARVSSRLATLPHATSQTRIDPPSARSEISRT